jgi:two-component system chemotaxis response regulator CheB
VEQILAQLPPALEAKVLVVQHMPASFTDRLAQRLDDRSEYAVSEATDGGSVTPGEVLVAKGGCHLSVTSARTDRLEVALTDGPRRHGVRPSIDVTMETLADHDSLPLVGVVLTGMGKDGAAGIADIEAAGGTTIAQDEGTSPVYGIPRRAVETGAVDHVLPDSEIVTGIQQSLGGDSNG